MGARFMFWNSSVVHFGQSWLLNGREWSRDLYPGLWLAQCGHVTWILASDCPSVITWPGYWPLIGWTLLTWYYWRIVSLASRLKMSYGCNHHIMRSRQQTLIDTTNQRPVSRSCDHSWPIKGQYLRHMITLDQSEGSIQTLIDSKIMSMCIYPQFSFNSANYTYIPQSVVL